MASSSEIEKLERRWHENPAGLMFAPLAEAYRKAGNYQRALEVLEVGLAVHADYVPALIVRGRCHLDASDPAASETAFHQALACDPANPIALRSLADLYERSGRIDEAIERLTLLVEVDRGDGEARASLARLRESSAAVEPPPASPPELMPVGELDAEPVEPEALPEMAVPDPVAAEDRLIVETTAAEAFRIENLSIDPMASPEPPQLEPLGWEPMALPQWREPVPVDEPAGESGPIVTDQLIPEGEPISTAEPPPAPEPEPAVPGPIIWTPARWEAIAAEPEPQQAPVEAALPEEPLVEVAADLPAEAAEIVALALVVEPAAAAPVSEELVAPSPWIEPEPMPDSGPPESPQAAEIPWPSIEEPSAEEPAVAELPVAEAIAEEPVLIVTESMAELFLKQGHRELALAVYRQLAEREPADPRLLEAIGRLEAELAPESVPVAVPEPRRHAAAVTGGFSVEQYLQAALHAPPPATASTVLPPAIEPGVAGEPTRAIDQSLSLGAVFGDETPGPSRVREEEPSSVVAPAEPTYDEFFGAVPSAETAAFGAGAGGSLEVEDLRQFNEWLKGLKR